MSLVGDVKLYFSLLLALCMGCAITHRRVDSNLARHVPSISTDRVLQLQNQRRNDDLTRASKAISHEDWNSAAEALAAAYKRSPDDKAVRYYVMLYILSWNKAMERESLNLGLMYGYE